MKSSVSFYSGHSDADPAVAAWIASAGESHTWAQITIGGADVTVHCDTHANALAWLIKCRNELDRAIATAPAPPVPSEQPLADDEVPF